MNVKITNSKIDDRVITESVKNVESGAVITFLGTARVNSRGREVVHLEYDAYPEMAEKKMMEILEELKKQYSIKDAAFVHRIGKVEIGETIVAIAISAPHSKEAFDAGSYAVKRLKEVVPIWKKEVWSDGEEWIGYEGVFSELNNDEQQQT